jgi:hypothetical protein
MFQQVINAFEGGKIKDVAIKLKRCVWTRSEESENVEI